jgi:hypothetical protein
VPSDSARNPTYSYLKRDVQWLTTECDFEKLIVNFCKVCKEIFTADTYFEKSMMETEKTAKDYSAQFMRVLYVGFVVLGIYFLIFSKDLSQFVINFSIALVFDPLDQKITWKDRKNWQKAWLIVHTVIALFAAGLLFTDNFI